MKCFTVMYVFLCVQNTQNKVNKTSILCYKELFRLFNMQTIAKNQ